MIRLPGLTILTNEEYKALTNELNELKEVYSTEAKEYNLQVQYGERLAKDLDAVQGEFNDLDRRYLQVVAAFADYKSVVHGLLQQ